MVSTPNHSYMHPAPPLHTYYFEHVHRKRHSRSQSWLLVSFLCSFWFLRGSKSETGFSEQATTFNPNASQATKGSSRQVIRELEGQITDAYPSRQPRIDVEEKEEAIVGTNPLSALGDGSYHKCPRRRRTGHRGCAPSAWYRRQVSNGT